MKFSKSIIVTLLTTFNAISGVDAFVSGRYGQNSFGIDTKNTALQVSIGLGPDAEEEKKIAEAAAEKAPLVEPDHELFRDSRLTDFDRQCDSWYESLLGTNNEQSFLGEVSEEALRRIKTLHKLERNVSGSIYMGDLKKGYFNDESLTFLPFSLYLLKMMMIGHHTNKMY